MDKLMDMLSVLSFLFGSGSLVAVWRFFTKKVKDEENKDKALRLGVQALLRDRLLQEYNKWFDRGYAPIYAKENFENLWTQYHNLGVNGVMDEIHKTFMDLPTERRS